MLQLEIKLEILEIFLAQSLSILLSNLNFALMVLALSIVPIVGVDHALLDLLKTRRVTKPIVFKSKDISLRNIGTNLKFTR
jgi:E3 ubiquitin-protein ligase DOA10